MSLGLGLGGVRVGSRVLRGLVRSSHLVRLPLILSSRWRLTPSQPRAKDFRNVPNCRDFRGAPTYVTTDNTNEIVDNVTRLIEIAQELNKCHELNNARNLSPRRTRFDERHWGFRI